MENELRINCSELEALIKTLHSETTIDDLELNEMMRVFPDFAEAVRAHRGITRESGGGFLGAQLPEPALTGVSRNVTLRQLYRENCAGK